MLINRNVFDDFDLEAGLGIRKQSIYHTEYIMMITMSFWCIIVEIITSIFCGLDDTCTVVERKINC